LIRRDVELVTGGVLNEQVVAGGTGDIAVHEALKTSDAVVMMDNVVPRIQVAIGLFMPFSPPPARRPVRAPATGYFTFTNDGDPERRKDKTVVDSARQHCRLDGIENVDHRESSTGFGEKVGDARCGTRAVHRDNHVDSTIRPAGDRSGNGFGISGRGPEPPHFVALIPRRGGNRRGLQDIGAI
jgi:hypothetical protein